MMQSNTLLIKCPGCSRGFPVNLKKHLNRATRFCPFCRTEVKVHEGIFTPQSDWPHIKAMRAIRKIIQRRRNRDTYTDTEMQYLMRFSEVASDISKDMYDKKRGKR